MRNVLHYMAPMQSDEELKRLRWRATHRGTREADFLVGGYFERHHASWGPGERAWFADLLTEQDVDIMAWALGTAAPPERLEGKMMHALRKLDYVPTAR